nr:hypothetical protein [Tanacetum cinerariifolium]GEZ33391.1 hypothetical protein [Tanacetum cinerariifolium]
MNDRLLMIWAAKDDDGLDDKDAKNDNDKDEDEDEDDDPSFVVTITQHNFKGSFCYVGSIRSSNSRRES